MSKAAYPYLAWLDRIDEKHQKLADLKAELEMVSYEEFEALTKRVEALEARFDELLEWLTIEKKEAKE